MGRPRPQVEDVTEAIRDLGAGLDRRLAVRRGLRWVQWPGSSARFSQHRDEHRPERPVRLAVDEWLGEGPSPAVLPVRSDPVDPVEVREHQDVEQLGASRQRRRDADVHALLSRAR
jgi:hypothetical protein